MDDAQTSLFDAPLELPHGLLYRPAFVGRDEERELIAAIESLPLRQARFQGYFAKRRVVHFHSSAGVAADYDDSDDDRRTDGPLPAFLIELRQRIAKWLDIDPAAFIHALVSEYRPGSPIGWHRDKPVYGDVVGVSLAGWGRMRFRPLDPRSTPKTIAALDLEPRSVYVMRGPIRWHWQHSLLPTKSLRYSITFRTAA